MAMNLMEAAQRLYPHSNINLSKQEKIWEYLYGIGYKIVDRGFTGNSLKTDWTVKRPIDKEIPISLLKAFYREQMIPEGDLPKEYTEALIYLALSNMSTMERDKDGIASQIKMWEIFTLDPRPFEFEGCVEGIY